MGASLFSVLIALPLGLSAAAIDPANAARVSRDLPDTAEDYDPAKTYKRLDRKKALKKRANLDDNDDGDNSPPSAPGVKDDDDDDDKKGGDDDDKTKDGDDDDKTKDGDDD